MHVHILCTPLEGKISLGLSLFSAINLWPRATCKTIIIITYKYMYIPPPPPPG